VKQAHITEGSSTWRLRFERGWCIRWKRDNVCRIRLDSVYPGDARGMRDDWTNDCGVRPRWRWGATTCSASIPVS